MSRKSTRIHHQVAGDAITRSSLILVGCLSLFCFAQPAHAEITWSGDIGPADPTTWTSSTDGYIGHTGSGTLDINDDSDVLARFGYIGNYSGSTGEVTVDGTGSTWTNAANLYVGYKGSGTLNITSGGAVSNYNGYIGYDYPSTGTVTVDGTGSTWTNSGSLLVGDDSASGTLNITGGGEVIVEGDTQVSTTSSSLGAIHFDNGTLTTGGFTCDFDDLTGTGTINTAGLICDVDLVFDATHGLNQTFNIKGKKGMRITVNLNVDGLHRMGFGNGGAGSMSISDGIVLQSSAGYIGYKYDSTGEVTVDGAGSTWTNSDSLLVGFLGSGTLDITNGGTVSNNRGDIGYWSTSTGEVTVDGAGSTWTSSDHLYVGHNGSGTLNITSGGAVSNGRAYVGRYSSLTSEVTVDGAGSKWTNNSFLHVGSYGSGTLNITDGGTVTVEGDTWVAYSDTASGTIHFDNGTLTTGGLICAFDDLTGMGTINTHGLVSDVDLVFNATHGLSKTFNINYNPGQDITLNLNVDGSGSMGAGYGGAAAMSISDGIVIESTEGYIGYKSGSTGQVTVDGAGSTWTNSSSLYVGNSGNGTLNITGGGAVSNYNGYIGRGSGSTGEVTVDGAGSTWTNSDYLYVGYYGNGTLNITGGAVSSGSGYIGYNTVATGVVTVDGAGSTWKNNSFLYVAHWGSGTLNITDSGLVSVAGILAIDRDEDGDGFINMASGGMLALLGDADDSLVEFLGLVGGTDAIRYWDDSISGWANITGATYGNDYMLGYLVGGCLDGYTVLSVGAPEPGMVGDATHDGVVNDADARLLATYWQTTSGALWGMGDFNGDGAVNDIDATMLAANWGNSTSGAVPEPSVLVGLLGLCLAGLLAQVRRWQCHPTVAAGP